MISLVGWLVCRRRRKNQKVEIKLRPSRERKERKRPKKGENFGARNSPRFETTQIVSGYITLHIGIYDVVVRSVVRSADDIDLRE